jgi:hypothetical protein
MVGAASTIQRIWREHYQWRHASGSVAVSLQKQEAPSLLANLVCSGRVVEQQRDGAAEPQARAERPAVLRPTLARLAHWVRSRRLGPMQICIDSAGF